MSEQSRVRIAIARWFLGSTVLSGTGIVFSYLLGSVPPAQLLADHATRLFPPRVFSLLLDALLYWGKPLLLLALTLFWLAAGAVVAGVIDLTIRRLGRSGRESSAAWTSIAAGCVVVALGLVVVPVVAGAGMFGARLDSGAGGYSLSVIMSAAGFAVALYYLNAPDPDRADPLTEGAGPWGRSLGRRDFVFLMAASGLALGGGLILSRTVANLLSGARAVALQLAGVPVPEITPAADFYVVSKNFRNPSVDTREWKLEVVGGVKNPLRLSLDEVRALPPVQQYVTLECVSNEVGGGLIGNALWSGVRMGDVLRAAGLNGDNITHVLTTSVDGYTESLPIEAALADDVILAYEMNGEPLTADHGFPLRLLIPGRYGMKSTKWLNRIEAATSNRPGYWEVRGWNEQAWVKTMTRIDVPGDSASLPPGPGLVAGVAFSGARGISRVEVSTDAGVRWTPADLRPPLSKLTWVHWRHERAPFRGGRYTIAARAFDGDGVPQIADATDPFPSGATGYHMIIVDVVA